MVKSTCGSVKRCYGNLCRTFHEQKEEKVETSELQAQTRKYVCNMFYFTNIAFSLNFKNSCKDHQWLVKAIIH